MAVDTRNKRASCLGVALAICLTLPLADGTVAQADRQQTAYSYAGIAAAAPTVIATPDDRIISVQAETRTIPVPSEDRTEVPW